MAQTPTKAKKSALLRYALNHKPVRGPDGALPNTRKGKGGVSLRPVGRAPMAAPNTPLGRYANRQVDPSARMPSRQYRGQADLTPGLSIPVQQPGGGGGGSWWQNLGKDAISMVTGVPGALSLAGRTAAAGFVAPYAYSHLPGSGAVRGFTEHTGSDLVKAGQAAIDDIKYRWGPAFEAGGLIDIALDRDNARSDMRRFGSRIKEHPGFFALDVASIFSAGQGAAVRSAGLAGKVGRDLSRARHAKAAESRIPFPENTPPPGPRSTVLRRVTSPQPAGVTRGLPAAGRVEQMLTDPSVSLLASSRKMANRTRVRNVSQKATVAAKDGKLLELEMPTKAIPLRPYAANPGTRALQRGFDEKVLGGLEKYANKLGKTKKGADRFMSTPARDARALKRHQRERTARWESARDQTTHEVTRDYAREVLYKRGITKDNRAEALVALRVDNVAVDKPGRTAWEGVQQYLAEQERRIAEDRARGVPEEALRDHQANIELVKSIPRAMVETPSRAIVEGAEEARTMLTRAQDIRGQASGIYGISDETRARADLYREAVSTGQASFFEDVGGLMNPERRQAIVDRGYAHVPLPDVVRAARELYTGGPVLGRRTASREGMARAQELIAHGQLPTPGTAGAASMLKGSRLNEATARAVLRHFEGRAPLNRSGNIHTGVLEQQMRRDRVLREAMTDPGNLFRPGEKPAGGGVYRGSTPVGYAAGHKSSNRSSFGMGELGRADKQTTGHRIGRDSLSRESMMLTVQKSINALFTQKSVRDTIDRFALRQVGGTRPYALRTADAISQLDPERWTAVSVRELERLVEELDGLQPGQSASAVSKFANREEILRRVADGDESVIALPTPLVNEIKQAIDNPNGLLQKYDSAMNLWRAGILAYTPRWFVNNLVGTTIFLGVMSGLDVRAFLQASRNKRFYSENAVPFESEAVSHSYSIGRSEGGRGGLEPQTASRFMRGAHTMFLLNQRLEGRLRRAAYIARAKQNLRNEGTLRRRNLLKTLSDDELFDAMVKMPDDLKRQTLKDMEFFVGRYKSYSHLEQRFLRRIIPFWSWIRVINTWSFGLPFKSPLRAEAVRVATSMGHAVSEDTTGLPLWEKGRFTFGDFAMRTNNINPLYSVAEEIAGMTGADSPEGGLTDMSRVLGGSLTPPLQMAIGQITGRNPFGTRDFTAPQGYGGTVSSFGSDPIRRNPVTGEIESVHASPNFFEQAFDSVIPFASTARQALAGSRQPYDTSSSIDLALGKLGLKDEDALYQPPPKTPSGRGRLPAGASTALGLLGAPIYTRDREQELAAAAAAEKRLLQAQRDSARQKLREAIRRRMDLERR